jgi:hypothetical protein
MTIRLAAEYPCLFLIEMLGSQISFTLGWCCIFACIQNSTFHQNAGQLASTDNDEATNENVSHFA